MKLISKAALFLLVCSTSCYASHSSLAEEVITYYGAGDASAAVAVGEEMFIVADDEDNVLRVYKINQTSSPVLSYDLTQFLGIEPDGPEADIEGAAVIGDRIYWITSHGRNKDGKIRPNRYRFFATEVKIRDNDITISPVGTPCKTLVHRLLKTSYCCQPELARATQLDAKNLTEQQLKNLAPKKDGLNIEALCASADGKTIYIGFRNPRPDSKALVVPLTNAVQVIENQEPPVFAEPMLWDLNGLGIRAMEYSHFHKVYFVIAGPHNEQADFALYRWTGQKTDPLTLVRQINKYNFSPEALITFKDSPKLLLLSDDGTLAVDVSDRSECMEGKLQTDGTCLNKHLTDSSKKRFRAILISGLSIIPIPKFVKTNQGRLSLGERIVVRNAKLRPLADIVSEEIQLLTGKKLSVDNKTARSGDILLEIDPTFKGESYLLEADDTVSVRGGSYASVPLGTVTLLQALVAEDNKVYLPHLTVTDEPFAEYRGLMIDLARKWHDIETLKQIVVLCRWYKIRYLQLHFSDDQSFTFPSTAFPELPTPGRHYDLTQLRDLETFARNRGVTIIPELDVPGHSRAALGAMGQVLGCDPPGKHTLCPGREETYETLDTLIGEFCDVFQSTPYFHLGADEVDKAAWAGCKYCSAYVAENNIENTDELYRHFIVRMNDVVKKHGRKTIVWEGFHREGNIRIPRDITVMVFECLYNLPNHLIEDGYNIINTSWQPLYVVNQKCWSPEYIYGWNMYRWENWWEKSKIYLKGMDVKPTTQVLGAQMRAWEQPNETELPSLRHRLPAMSERIWNPDAKRDFKDFAERMSVTDAKLTILLQGTDTNTDKGEGNDK